MKKEFKGQEMFCTIQRDNNRNTCLFCALRYGATCRGIRSRSVGNTYECSEAIQVNNFGKFVVRAFLATKDKYNTIKTMIVQRKIREQLEPS